MYVLVELVSVIQHLINLASQFFFIWVNICLLCSSFDVNSSVVEGQLWKWRNDNGYNNRSVNCNVLVLPFLV